MISFKVKFLKTVAYWIVVAFGIFSVFNIFQALKNEDMEFKNGSFSDCAYMFDIMPEFKPENFLKFERNFSSAKSFTGDGLNDCQVICKNIDIEKIKSSKYWLSLKEAQKIKNLSNSIAFLKMFSKNFENIDDIGDGDIYLCVLYVKGFYAKNEFCPYIAEFLFYDVDSCKLTHVYWKT